MFNDEVIIRSQQRFRSDHHRVYTEEVNKIALSSNDDKRIQTFDKVTTYSYRTNAFKVYENEIRYVILKNKSQTPGNDSQILWNDLQILRNDSQILRNKSQALRSDHHRVYTEEVNKIALNSNNDKKIQIFDKFTVFPYEKNVFKVCENEMLLKAIKHSVEEKKKLTCQ